MRALHGIFGATFCKPAERKEPGQSALLRLGFRYNQHIRNSYGRGLTEIDTDAPHHADSESFEEVKVFA